MLPLFVSGLTQKQVRDALKSQPGDPRFDALLEEIRTLHNKKMVDYGQDEDPLANVRGSSEWGIEPWVGAMVRANDKMKRLQKAAKGKTLVNESVEDSLLDLAVYSLISLLLFREKFATLPPEGTDISLQKDTEG